MEPALDQGTGTRAVGAAVQVQGANRVRALLGLATTVAQVVAGSGDGGGGSRRQGTAGVELGGEGGGGGGGGGEGFWNF